MFSEFGYLLRLQNHIFLHADFPKTCLLAKDQPHENCNKSKPKDLQGTSTFFGMIAFLLVMILSACYFFPTAEVF